MSKLFSTILVSITLVSSFIVNVYSIEHSVASASNSKASIGPSKSKLRMTIFSNFIIFGEINYRGINDAVSVKGSLTDADGNGLANREILLYVRVLPYHFLMGKTRTDSDGCFYFNNWNNTALKPLLDKYAGSGSFRIKIWTIFHGDHDYNRSFAYREDAINMILPLGPAPNFWISATKAVVNAGGSVDVPVHIYHNAGNEKIQNLTLSLEALPCNGVRFSTFPLVVPNLTYNSSSQLETGNATIHISVDYNVQADHYTLVVAVEAITKDLNTGEQRHMKEWLGLLHLAINPAVSVTEKQCSTGDLPAGSRAGPYIRIWMSMHTNKTSGNELELKASESANVTIYLTSEDNPDARNLIDHLSGCKLHILQAGEIHYPYSTDTIPPKMPIGTDAKLDKQTLMIKPINEIAKEARLDDSFVLDQATLTINTNSSVKPGMYLIGIPVRGFSGVVYEAILVFRLTLA